MEPKCHKIRTQIIKININDATYSNEELEPTLINLFYGRNGSGKSTLAKCIRDKKNLSWKADNDNIEITVFDEDYVKKTVENYGQMEGVFTLAADGDDRIEFDSTVKERALTESELAECEEKLVKLDSEKEKLKTDCEDEVWERTRIFREDLFPKLSYPGKKKNLLSYLHLKYLVVTTLNSQYFPEDKDNLELNALLDQYKTLFSDDVQEQYEEYKTIDLISIPRSNLISKPIISRSNTDFAKFVRALGNFEWLKFGNEHYLHTAGGKCPFCQRDDMDLDSFNEGLKSCYDKQYNEDIENLYAFIDEYKNIWKQIKSILDENREKAFFDSNLLQQYRNECEAFKDKINVNLSLLDKKRHDPSLEIKDFYELSLDSIVKYIREINARIQLKIRMQLIKNKEVEKEKLRTNVDRLMVTECMSVLDKYLSETAIKNALITDYKKNKDALTLKKNGLNEKIALLSETSTTTLKVMKQINETIKYMGFKGFYLREKINEPHLYELVRDNGETVKKNLSEGERNFIAFLYFYHKVMEMYSRDGNIQNKIVVIDDPVSSMDHQTLLYVANLVREMMSVCYNNYALYNGVRRDDHIKQFFCLTHNPIFFRDIVYNRIDQYEFVSLFEITKEGGTNCSCIRECHEDINGVRENRNPAKSYYDSIWYDFRITKDKKTLMNAARQIIYYFFIREHGYDDIKFSEMLLDGENKKILEKKHAYYVALSMLDMLSIRESRFNDGLSFDDSAYDIDFLRSAFREIFVLMKQEQYYNFKMGLA